jgi:hypothetical protein
MASHLTAQLKALDTRQRRVFRLDRLATVNDIAASYVTRWKEHPSAVESALTLFRYGVDVHNAVDTVTLLSDLRAFDGAAKQRRRWAGAKRYDAITAAIAADNEQFNSWALDRLGDVLAVSQAIHIVDEVCRTPKAERWNLCVPEVDGQLPDFTRCGVSPLAAVLEDAPTATDPTWHPMWAMRSASRRLTAHLDDLGLARKRTGSFAAATTDNPDRVSQAANSAIELMTRTGRELIRRHPQGTVWLNELADGRPHVPPRALLRGAAAVPRGVPAPSFEEACRADVAVADCARAALRLRGILERLKHDDSGRSDEDDRLRRCLVATEAVMILLTGIVQLRVDDPAVTSQLSSFDLDELEQHCARATEVMPTRAMLTLMALHAA